jgi:cytochrome c-type biogenesis protein CcmH/NrfG
MHASMAKYIFVFLLFPLCLTAVRAEDQSSPKTGPIPDHSKEAVVIELSSTKVKFENDGTATRTDVGRFRIQSEAGVQRLGVLTFSYESANEALDIAYVRVHKSDGTLVATPQENVHDMAAQITREAPFYSDLREKHVAVKGLGIGDVLEYETSKRISKPLIAGQFWFEYSFSRGGIVLREQLELTVPLDRAIKINSTELKPAITDASGYRTYAWSTSHLQDDSDLQQKRKQDEAVWKQVRGRFPQPDVTLGSFRSWEEIGAWYGKLQQDQIKPTPEIRAKASEITKDAKDDDAKIRAIYQYVSTQFHYIGIAFGIGRYQPHAASEVLENQYGDCKDKHTLFASLLNAVGIKAYPALISSSREIDADVPSPGQFDHVITFVPRESGALWLDTTPEVEPFAYLVSSLRDKHALVIPDDKPAFLVNTPAGLPFPSTETFRMDAKLSDAGVLEGNAEITVRGDLEYVLRSAFRSVPFPNWKDLTQRVSYGLGFSGDVSEATASSPEKIDEPFHFSYKYTKKDFGDWPSHRILAAVPVINLPTLNDEQTAPTFPVWIGGPSSETTLHSEVELPKSLIPMLPTNIQEKTDFAEYDAKYSLKNGLFIADRHFSALVREVPVSEFERYKAFRKVVEDDYNSFVPLVSGVASATTTPAGTPEPSTSIQGQITSLPDSSNQEAIRLENEARDAVDKKDMQTAISSLYRAVASDSKFTRGWLMLGTLLMASKQTDAGEDAFQKAIAADPKQPVTYKTFAYSLMANSKFDDAIPVWRDLIKLSPDDVDGPANLGSCLLALKRYAEAAAALESASKLDPGRSNLQWQLASAYLNADNHAKAAAIFQKILQAHSDPEALNNAAYALAATDDELPTALRYAQRAVRAEEEASQKVTLPQLRVEDLEQTPRLFAYWDTLGLINGHLSNMEQAEKYLKASWVLSLNGFAASHLCHYYERLNRPKTAARMCQLALQRLPLAAGPGMYKATSEIEETRARLEHISPGSSKSGNLNSVLDDITSLRSFKMPRLLTGPVNADFFVLLASDSKTRRFKVQDVKFISGSEKLRSASKKLSLIDFNFASPDDIPTHIVRRGTLGCYPYGGCFFVLLDPDSVHSLN